MISNLSLDKRCRISIWVNENSRINVVSIVSHVLKAFGLINWWLYLEDLPSLVLCFIPTSSTKNRRSYVSPDSPFQLCATCAFFAQVGSRQYIPFLHILGLLAKDWRWRFCSKQRHSIRALANSIKPSFVWSTRPNCIDCIERLTHFLRILRSGVSTDSMPQTSSTLEVFVFTYPIISVDANLALTAPVISGKNLSGNWPVSMGVFANAYDLYNISTWPGFCRSRA